MIQYPEHIIDDQIYYITCDPYVLIEEKREGYIRYVMFKDTDFKQIDKRWEVLGICTGIGKCWEGAVNEKPILDCPVAPGFSDNCCPLIIKEL